MEALPKEIELSCLPTFDDEKRSAEIYLSSSDRELLESQCQFFKDRLDELGIEYS
jgi:hypothetical protein